VSAVVLSLALHPSISAADISLADPVEASPPRAIVFAVDAVVGQAYLSQPEVKPGQSYSIAILNLGTGQPAGQVNVPTPPSSMSVNALSGLVYLANPADNSVSILHGSSQRIVSTVTVEGGPQAILVDPPSGRLFVGLAQKDAIVVLDASTLAPLGRIDVNGETSALAIDRIRGRVLALTRQRVGAAGMLISADPDRLTVVTRLAVTPSPTGLSILDALGRIFVTCQDDDGVQVIDAESFTPLKMFDNVGSPVRGMAVNERRGRLYLSTGDLGLILTVDPATGAVLGTAETVNPADVIVADSATGRVYAANAARATVESVLDPAELPRETSATKITFQVSGGLAGLSDILSLEPSGHASIQRRNGTVMERDLGSSRIQDLTALFYESEFFALQRRYSTPRPVPDSLEFVVTFKDGQKEQIVTMNSAGAPPPVLVEIVRRLERVRQEMVSPPAPGNGGRVIPSTTL
jgi:DNA-binding beta-propeller fold protein YncE